MARLSRRVKAGSEPDALQATQVMEQVGRYSVVRELGRGGTGEIYLARDTRLDRQAATKALPAHLAQGPDREPSFRQAV